MYQKQNGSFDHFSKMSKTHQPMILVLGDLLLRESIPGIQKDGVWMADLRAERERSLGLAGYVAEWFVKRGAQVALASVVGEDQGRLDVEELLAEAGIDHCLHSAYDFPTPTLEIYGGCRILKVAPVPDAPSGRHPYYDWPFHAVIVVDACFGCGKQTVQAEVARYQKQREQVLSYLLTGEMLVAPVLEGILDDIRRVFGVDTEDVAGSE